MKTLAWFYLWIAFAFLLVGFVCWLANAHPLFLVGFGVAGLTFTVIANCTYKSALDDERTKSSLTFGFRRISPDGERWEWWNGSHWLDYHSFKRLLGRRAYSQEYDFDDLNNQYGLTEQHPSRPCKRFLEADSSSGAE